MRPLADKTALVTGAARGIGRAIAVRLAQKGMRLALADRDVIGLACTRRAIERFGVEVVACPCDLAEPGQIGVLARAMLKRWAGVDLLVNNAGVAHYGPTHEHDPEETHRVLAVNLDAPIRLTQLLLPSLLARPESHVLNVASVLGLAVMPKTAAYCASKHGMVGFTDSLRREYARQGVGVTALCPGFVRTPLVERADDSGQRVPPALLCVTAERVARAAVRGVERNQRRVVVDPIGRLVRGAMALAPDAFDWMYGLGRRRRVAAKLAELTAHGGDRDAALRCKIGLSPREPDSRRRAA